MTLLHLELRDFRSFSAVDFDPDPQGTTVITGPNGTGKTTLLEAVAYLGLQRSFRGAPKDTLIRSGCTRAIVRAELVHDGVPSLVESEIVAEGRGRTMVNRQSVRTRRALLGVVPVTVFSPDDLVTVRGGPGARRDLLDDALATLDRQVGSQIDEFERILKQRTALLRQASGRLSSDVTTSLDVWDDRLDRVGTALAYARERLVADLEPVVETIYAKLSDAPGAAGVLERSKSPEVLPASGDRSVAMRYVRSWDGDLSAALRRVRNEDLRRAVTTVGPHRDDVVILLSGRDTRHQASQGEQRSVGVALRLAVHELMTARSGQAPILLLDDVFSELDLARSRALVGLLPPGQALVTTALALPSGVDVAASVDVAELRSVNP